MKKNDLLTLIIEDLNNLGYGVAHVDGKAVFVSGAVDGDTVSARIIKDNKTYSVAKTESIVTPSEHRIQPVCPVSDKCGGCAYASVTYEHEKEIKYNSVKYAFIKNGIADAEIADVYSDGNTENYRNKAIIPIGFDGEKFISGFFAPKTHRIIPAKTCALHKQIFSEMCDTAKAFMNSSKETFITNGLSLVKSLYFRSAENGDTELTIILEAENSRSVTSLTEHLISKHKEIKTVYTNLNPGDISTVLSHDFKLVYGDGYITDTLNGAKLKITPASFYQVNKPMAEALYNKGAELLNAKESDSVCDLYCGIGSIGLSVFSQNKLVGIEVVESAVECAKENAQLNGADAKYYCGDAAEVIEKMNLSFDAVVLDPPRKGVTPELITYLCSNKRIPKILYISCNANTLARDAALIKENGYKMSAVYPFDLFPRTAHCECVTLFTLQ